MNKKVKIHRPGIKIIRTALLGIILTVIVYLVIDYYGPSEIKLKNETAFGLPCLRARDLIVQEYDQDGILWASRGMIIYKLDKDHDKFTKVAHVPTGLSIFWLRNFTILRRITVRPECIEMVTTKCGDICALSAGKIWYLQAGEKKFKNTFVLDHYGFGDQGIRNDGILYAGDSILYFGEYFSNPERTGVNLYKSNNNGKSWKITYHFKEGQIRHIHALQKDPYSERLWICTGDYDYESMVACSIDSFRTLTSIGLGNQIWRVCQLVFTENAVYWGTDTGNKNLSGIYKWDRASTELSNLQKTDGAVFYGTRLAGGTIVMSADREGMASEKDDKTRIYIITDKDKITCIEAGTWKHKRPGLRFKFAKLRFQRDHGAPSLAISCLNQKEFPDGDLIIINEKTLIKAASSD
jgi:hypothetical protein